LPKVQAVKDESEQQLKHKFALVDRWNKNKLSTGFDVKELFPVSTKVDTTTKNLIDIKDKAE